MHHEYLLCAFYICGPFKLFIDTSDNGIGGEVPIFGNGKVKVHNTSIYDVANFPSMHFDLISIRCGPFVSGCYFVFDNEFDLCGLQLQEDKKIWLIQRNNLYVLDLSSTV